jgi:hypothetical protein
MYTVTGQESIIEILVFMKILVEEMQMKKTAALIVLVLLLLLVLPAMAGVEPSPFAPQIGKLNSIANSLSSVSQRLNAAYTRMGVGPSPFRSEVNQWEAEANKLDVLQGRLDLVVIVLEDEELDTDVEDALVKVKEAAKSVVEATKQWEEGEPGNNGGLLPDALVPVREGAEAIVSSVNEILRYNGYSGPS